MKEYSSNNFTIEEILDDIEKIPTNFSSWVRHSAFSPKNDESLLSWLIRQASSYYLTLKDYLMCEKEFLKKFRNIDVKLSSNWYWVRNADVTPSKFLIQILDTYNLKSEDLTIRSQIKRDKIDETQLVNNHRRLHAHYKRDLYMCPICWQEIQQRYFKKKWRLTHIFLCEKHNVRLVSECKNCNTQLFQAPHYFSRYWFTKCHRCGYEYLDLSYPQVDKWMGEVQNLISYSYNNKDIKSFIDGFAKISLPIQQLKSLGQYLKNMVGYLGIIGLIVAVIEVYCYFKTEDKVPTYRDGFHAVCTAIGRSEWIEFGISTWNDLLQLVLNSINKERGKYNGKNGLETAISETKEFYKKFNRLPTNRDHEMLGISNALYKGEWKQIGYVSWNDLLKEVFGDINVIMNYYIGEEGLKRAINGLKDFYNKNKVIPTSSSPEVSGIITAISRGEWENLGIRKWNELLIRVFGKINLEPNKYTKDTSFEQVITELKEFWINNDRLPTINDDGMEKIAAAVYRKIFTKQGISNWNELLLHVFGKINFVGKDAYTGEKGVTLAKYKLRTFFAKHQFQPSPSSKGMKALGRAIKNGNFVKYDIKSWDDLLILVFGIVEKKKKSSKGSIFSKKVRKQTRKIASDEFFQESLEFLVEFKETRGKLPKTRDEEVKMIIEYIRNGYFRKFGVNRWNDMLTKAFSEVNQRKNIYIKEHGLQRAVKELKEFEKENNRLPTTYDRCMGGILRAVKRGEWVDMNITSWNELLKNTFGEMNLKRGKYNGINGLDLAKEELLDFYKKYHRLPKYKDKEVVGIIGAIQCRKWITLGIRSWNDLLMSTFLEN